MAQKWETLKPCCLWQKILSTCLIKKLPKLYRLQYAWFSFKIFCHTANVTLFSVNLDHKFTHFIHVWSTPWLVWAGVSVIHSRRYWACPPNIWYRSRYQNGRLKTLVKTTFITWGGFMKKFAKYVPKIGLKWPKKRGQPIVWWLLGGRG